jgi:hypothetical protein
VGPRNNIKLPDGMEMCQDEDASNPQCLVTWQIKTMNERLSNKKYVCLNQKQ